MRLEKNGSTNLDNYSVFTVLFIRSMFVCNSHYVFHL